MENDAVDMVATYTDADLVKLEFFQGGRRVLWIDLTREKAADWAGKIATASGTYWLAPMPLS